MRLAEGSVVGGNARDRRLSSDIRGKVVKPGVYTLRYALQPQNGDHLGAAPNREFLLLVAGGPWIPMPTPLVSTVQPRPRQTDDRHLASGEPQHQSAGGHHGSAPVAR